MSTFKTTVIKDKKFGKLGTVSGGSGEANDGENCIETPGSVGVYIDKPALNLRFRGLKSESSSLSISESDSGKEICFELNLKQEVTVPAVPANTWTKVPTTLNSIYDWNIRDASGQSFVLSTRLTAPDCLEIMSTCDETDIVVCLIGE